MDSCDRPLLLQSFGGGRGSRKSLGNHDSLQQSFGKSEDSRIPTMKCLYVEKVTQVRGWKVRHQWVCLFVRQFETGLSICIHESTNDFHMYIFYAEVPVFPYLKIIIAARVSGGAMSGKNGPFGHTIVFLHISEHVLYCTTKLSRTLKMYRYVFYRTPRSFTRYQQGTVRPILSATVLFHASLQWCGHWSRDHHHHSEGHSRRRPYIHP